MQVKIADFWVARFNSFERVTVSAPGIPILWWTAPEVIENIEYETKSDVFSFGIVIWELLTGKLPYAELTTPQVGNMYGLGCAFLCNCANVECISTHSLKRVSSMCR